MSNEIEYIKGDEFVLTKDNTTLTATYVTYPNAGILPNEPLGELVPAMKEHKWQEKGWKVECTKRAPRPLPTKPGNYLTRSGVVVTRTGEGWESVHGGRRLSEHAVRGNTPLTRIYLEAEVDNRVNDILDDLETSEEEIYNAHRPGSRDAHLRYFTYWRAIAKVRGAWLETK